MQKRCSKCKEFKLLDLFHRNKRNKKDGRHNWCKACVSIRDKGYWKNSRCRKKGAVSKKDIEIIREIKYSLDNDIFLKDDLYRFYAVKKILDEFKNISYKSDNAQRLALLRHGEALCTKCGYVKPVNDFSVKILERSVRCKKCDAVYRKINKSILSDNYIITLLRSNGLSLNDIPESLIRAKRQQIKTTQIIKGE